MRWKSDTRSREEETPLGVGDSLPQPLTWTIPSHRLRAFSILDLHEVETVAHAVIGQIIDEIEGPAIDAYIQHLIDERRGR